MHSLSAVKERLAGLGYQNLILARGEVVELAKVLRKNESILGAVVGFCNAAPAMMVATNKRLLFIDKRFYHCKVDDIPYRMIGEVEDNIGMLSRIKVLYRGGEIEFKGVPRERANRFVDTLEKKIENGKNFSN